MRTVYSSDVLSSTAKSGKEKHWRVIVVEDDSLYYLRKEYWQGDDGKHQLSDPYLVKGKNTGKSNETTDKEQARLEMERAVAKQLDSGYHKEGEVYEGYQLPMTAYKWKDRKKNITFPCAIQAKWDGIRNNQFGGVNWSRKGKVFLPELVKHLIVKTDYILDGELVIEGESFQTITSFVKKKQSEQERLEYHVFDLMIENMPFSERFEILMKLAKKFPSQVKLSETFFVENENEISELHARFTEFFDYNSQERNKMGYFEGTMIRNLSGLYTINHRSADLLKLKDFVDEEFEIVDFYEGKGRSAGTITFICKCGEELFHVNPMGTIEYRTKMWDDRKKLKGKMLTVEFQEKTERGVPRFPVGKSVRDYE
jgi:DNA ligase-1